jgi:hypothetical protein
MDVSAIVYFDQPMTLAGIERVYASSPGNHPMLILEEITPTSWKAALDPRHTAPIELEELKRLLRLRLGCRTD